MKICLVTPAAKGSRSGNRVTATRWSRILRQLGHRVHVHTEYDGSPADALVAIHAWRSAGSVAAFRAAWPGKPVVVLLAGTDIYRFAHSHRATTVATMAAADRLVGLHEGVGEDIPPEFRSRLHIIYQSAVPLPGPREPVRRWFQVCVIGHLREEKDSLRTAFAARRLPAFSRIRVVQLGAAHDESWAKAADDEIRHNPRFEWRGEVPRGAVRRCFARSHAMVISSVMEGGANVVSEAMVAGLPVIASEIPGNLGLLGKAHPAYYPPRDDAALASLLLRAESEPGFLERVAASGAARAARFEPERELQAWHHLLAGL